MAAPSPVQSICQPKLGHIVERTPQLFNNADMSDVSFIFKTFSGDPVKIYGHKLVLGISSPLFHKMFYNNDQLSTSVVEDNENEIQMTEEKYGFDCVAFYYFMKFLYKYTDNIPWTELSVETIVGILQCSDCYDIPRLKTEAVKELLSKLNIENAIFLLEAALLCKDKDLEDESLEIIDLSAETVFQSEGILEAKMETLYEIVKRNSLAIEESKVLNACLKWSEKECERKGLALTAENKRQVLDKIFFEIRCPILPSLKIAELVRSKFLTIQESSDMLLNMHCAGNAVNDDNKGLIPETPFKTEKRNLWTCEDCGEVHNTYDLCSCFGTELALNRFSSVRVWFLKNVREKIRVWFGI